MNKIEEKNKLRDEIKEELEKELKVLIRGVTGEIRDMILNKDDKILLNNNFSRFKVEVREIYKELEECLSNEKIISNTFKLDLTERERKELEKHLNKLNKEINVLKQLILSYGSRLAKFYIPLLDANFSEGEIIKLLGGKYNEAKRIKKIYYQRRVHKKSLTFNFIINRIEYECKAGKCKEIWEGYCWEMPLFNCLNEYVFNAVRKDIKIYQELLNYQSNTLGNKVFDSIIDEDGFFVRCQRFTRILNINK